MFRWSRFRCFRLTNSNPVWKSILTLKCWCSSPRSFRTTSLVPESWSILSSSTRCSLCLWFQWKSVDP